MSAPNPIGDAIVAAARDAFDRRRRSYIDVPEWLIDGAPARIWYDPVSMEEYQELYSWRRADGTHYALAHAVVVKATDEAGARLFTAEHEIALIKAVDAAPMYRVANAILGMGDSQAIEKN